MTPLDITVPIDRDAGAKTAKADAPQGANVVRVEPVINDGDWDKGATAEIAIRVYWPDGRIETCSATVDLGYRTHPAATFVVGAPLDGAKIEAESRSKGVGVRLCCADTQNLPAKRERPPKRNPRGG